MLSTLERENSEREINATFKIAITRRRTKTVENELHCFVTFDHVVSVLQGPTLQS